VTALTAALTTGGASGAARTTPVRRLWRRPRPCRKTCGTETGWRTLPAGRTWLLDGRARDGPAAALGAISRQLLFALAQGNTDRRSSYALVAIRSQQVVRHSEGHDPAAHRHSLSLTASTRRRPRRRETDRFRFPAMLPAGFP
jgi:hypothetical protein